jgi:AraC family transcriptional regulator, transcriptional activator of pobA
MNNTASNKIVCYGIKDFHEDYKDLLVLSLEDYCKGNSDVIKNPHRIAFFQICVITEGEGRFWKDSNEYRYFPKSLFAISKGQVAAFEFEDMPKGYVVLFSEEFINRHQGGLEWLNNLALFDTALELSITSLTGLEYFELMVFIRKIKLEMESQNNFLTGEIVFLLLKTFLLISERLNTRMNNPGLKETGDRTYVNEFKKKLELMYPNSRTVNYYAGQLGITPRKLNQLTNYFCGVSAKQLIEDRVLLETKRLLIHTQMTIKEIGHSLGFNDPTNFNKFFKRYLKLTPMEFREINRKTDRGYRTTDNDHFQTLSGNDNKLRKPIEMVELK